MPEEWLDTSGFQDPAVGTHGALGRFSNFTPPTTTLDLSPFKDCPISQSAKLQFRVKSFNRRITPQFNPPSSSQGMPEWGRSVGKRGGLNRQFQFAPRFMLSARMCFSNSRCGLIEDRRSFWETGSRALFLGA